MRDFSEMPLPRPRPPAQGGVAAQPVGVPVPASPLPPAMLAPQQPPRTVPARPGTPPRAPGAGGVDPFGSQPGWNILPEWMRVRVRAGEFDVPGALQRYQSFLGANPSAQGNSNPAVRQYFGMPTGGAPASGGGAAMNPPPLPAGGDWGVPPMMGGGYFPGQMPQQQPMGFQQQSFYDPYALYASQLPLIQQGMHDNLANAMAGAGFTGNRFGTSAQRVAAQEGVRASNQANALLMQTLYGQANADQDRALQAAGQSMQLGGLLDQMNQNRFQALFPMAQWEQGRQDQMARFFYDDWYRRMMDPLQLMNQFFGSQGSGSGGVPIQTVTNPGRPGASDTLNALIPILLGGR